MGRRRLSHFVNAVAFGLAVAFATIGGCSIRWFPEQTSGSKALAVPFEFQIGAMWCGAAVVSMWRQYDRLPYMTQQQIGQAMGLDPSTGCSYDQITEAVRRFTSSGGDAVLDFDSDGSDANERRRRFFARQIASIDDEVPVIAYFSSLHSVIMTGGSWHYDGVNGIDIWDDVTYHDPVSGPQAVLSSTWVDRVCGNTYTTCIQTISSSAKQDWESEYFGYGGSDAPVGLRGGRRGSEIFVY